LGETEEKGEKDEEGAREKRMVFAAGYIFHELPYSSFGAGRIAVILQ
jgi:hypothetical protein